MASTKKAPFSARAKVWFPTHTSEMSGKATFIISNIFCNMPDDMREEVLSDLQARNEAILKRKYEAGL